MPSSTSNRPRLDALDVLRGLAVAGMILVVSPGDWSKTYAPLQHAAWNGATLADMVFPTFLFGVGMALGLSFPRPATSEAKRSFWTKLARRTVMLVVLGLLVEATYVWAIAAGAPYRGGPGLSHLRFAGILQRIGLCYFLAGAIAMIAARDRNGVVKLRPAILLAIAAAILIAYWALLSFVPVPGFGAGQLTPDGSLPAYVDRTLFTEPHLWPLGSATGSRPATYDPEGLLSTLPATVNVLIGALAAWAWRRFPSGTIGRIAIGGAGLIVLGLLLYPLMPINKRIWTSSFALLSGGVSAVAFAAIAAALRYRVAGIALTPFRVLGANAILAFLLSTLMSRISGFAFIPRHGEWIAPQQWGNAVALSLIPDPYLASFVCAAAVMAVVTLLIWPLHRRAIHFRL